MRLLTAVPTSGTSSQLQALAVRSQTRMLPCWSPAQHTLEISRRATLDNQDEAPHIFRTELSHMQELHQAAEPCARGVECTLSPFRARQARLLA